MSTLKPKKGDAVVLERSHSYHDAKMKRHEYNTFQIVRVTSLGRDGIIKGVELPGGEIPLLTGSYRLLTILDPEKQEGARRLLDTVTPDINNWPDIDSMKKAIFEAFICNKVL